MNKAENGNAANFLGLWLFVIAGGCVIATLTQTVADAQTKLKQMEARVATVEKKAAMIEALSGDMDSPYRRYYEAMQDLKRHQEERPQVSDRPAKDRFDKIEKHLDDAENRLSELDGKSRQGRYGYAYLGRGRSGLVGELENRIVDLENEVHRLRGDVRGIFFELEDSR